MLPWSLPPAFACVREGVSMAIPRRVYTQSHIEYVVEVILEVWSKRERLRGYEITQQAKFLRHFTAWLKPIGDGTASIHA